MALNFYVHCNMCCSSVPWHIQSELLMHNTQTTHKQSVKTKEEEGLRMVQHCRVHDASQSKCSPKRSLRTTLV